MVTLIRQTLDELHGEGTGNAVQVLYGGSVNPENSAAYLRIIGIDGLLVGGASLNYDQFARIVESAEKLA
jgi:triosephosphate isomerase